MATGIDTAQAFLEPVPEPPRQHPMPRRRFVFSLFFPGAAAAAGAVVFLFHAILDTRKHPIPKPGPRRYPPGYHRPETAR